MEKKPAKLGGAAELNELHDWLDSVYAPSWTLDAQKRRQRLSAKERVEDLLAQLEVELTFQPAEQAP